MKPASFFSSSNRKEPSYLVNVAPFQVEFVHFVKLVTMLRRWYGSKEQHGQDDAERQAKIGELRDAIGPLSGRPLKFCSDACLRRYLEARNWNFHKSKKMLEETLRWRATYRPEEIRWDEGNKDLLGENRFNALVQDIKVEEESMVKETPLHTHLFQKGKIEGFLEGVSAQVFKGRGRSRRRRSRISNPIS